ncbi:hypothetical protein HPB50_021260 [Hyalomma asiaticum]|uniref:Uncharacterized protein n=1 Tax=Hyalomma asiaticum TaxID=266040 RepID=A0ACB7TN70_HYAAI|nr:hypothetical protein HPB50_021260 [Hyalomma asiaticum]
MRHTCGTFCLPTYLVTYDSLLGNMDPELNLRDLVEKLDWNERGGPPWLLFQRGISGQGTMFQHGFVQAPGTGRGVGHPAAITSKEGEGQLMGSIEQALMTKVMVSLRQLHKKCLCSSGHATPQTSVDCACEWIQLPTASYCARHTLMPAADIEAQLCRAGQESVRGSILERLHFGDTRQVTSLDVADTTMVMSWKATHRRQGGPGPDAAWQ